jgi:hypothetical protein
LLTDYIEPKAASGYGRDTVCLQATGPWKLFYIKRASKPIKKITAASRLLHVRCTQSLLYNVFGIRVGKGKLPWTAAAPALAQIYIKFRLQLGLQLGRYLFTPLLDQNVEFS